MKIEQFEDKDLSHNSYAVLSECENKVVLIDPSRNVQAYLAFAELHQAKIIGVIETHPHADFVSGHLELHQITGAKVYCSKLVGASYPHQTFDEGDAISFGKIKLKAINTPGHSPDSISIILEYDGKNKAIFTGDTLFIGDCGRPDLRESAGNITAKREELAGQMYYSLREKIMILDDEVAIYPAHGAGSLCGKALSEAGHSTIGEERLWNWSVQDMDKTQFIKELLLDQPYIPKYFPFDVERNKQGAANFAFALAAIPQGKPDKLNAGIIIIDTRPEADFKKGHLPGSINLQEAGKFETWLGSIIKPEEAYYLVAGNEDALKNISSRTAKIGYETAIESAFIVNNGPEITEAINLELFKAHLENYTIVDIRNASEVKEHLIFADAINIPLPELRERVMEIPFNKPIVVHCAGGYRSAAGSSMIQMALGDKTKVFDLGESIKIFV